jgi:hypothetical protein
MGTLARACLALTGIIRRIELEGLELEEVGAWFLVWLSSAWIPFGKVSAAPKAEVGHLGKYRGRKFFYFLYFL